MRQAEDQASCVIEQLHASFAKPHEFAYSLVPSGWSQACLHIGRRTHAMRCSHIMQCRQALSELETQLAPSTTLCIVSCIDQAPWALFPSLAACPMRCTIFFHARLTGCTRVGVPILPCCRQDMWESLAAFPALDKLKIDTDGGCKYLWCFIDLRVGKGLECLAHTPLLHLPIQSCTLIPILVAHHGGALPLGEPCGP